MDTRNAPSAPREGLGNLGVKFYRYRNLVRSKWWILALAITIGLAYQAYVVSQKPVLYESTGQIWIRDEYVINTSVNRVANTTDFVGTNLAMLKSDEVMAKAEQRIWLEHNGMTGARPNIITAITPRTQIFTVTGQGADPAYTRIFVDATMQAFIDVRRENRDKQFGQIGEGYQGKIAAKETELKEAQAKLDAYVKANNMAFWQEQAKQSTTFLSELKTRRAKLETELQRFSELTPDQILRTSGAQAAFNANSPTTNQDTTGSSALSANLYSIYLQKSQELSVAQSRLEERSRVWKEKHPRLIALKDDVAAIRRSLDLVMQQNRDETEQRIKAIHAEIASLDQSITNVWEPKVAEASVKDSEYKVLDAEVKRIQVGIDEVRKNNEGLRDVFTDAFQKLQDATPAYEVNKGLKKHLFLGFMSGFMVGMVILILLDRADDRMTSSSEILNQFSEPILGQIPNVEESRGKAGLPLLQPDDERYSYAEAFRSLRSSLIFMPNQTELRTILVTSAIPNEGKSTITSNLAITMAAAGANVVVVDADLRRGDLASLFDMDGRTGLSNILRGEVPWQTAVQETRYPNLTLIPRGPVTNQSSELLLLPTLQKLLDGLKDNYDLIIFNTAPILATDDTPSLSPSFDGTVMVMRAQFTSARLTQNSLNALYQRQVNVLGLVLNCVDTEMPDYYYYRYPKYYAATS